MKATNKLKLTNFIINDSDDSEVEAGKKKEKKKVFSE